MGDTQSAVDEIQSTMKWATLLKDFKEKVGLAQSPSATPSPSSSASSPFRDSNASFPIHDFTYSPSR